MHLSRRVTLFIISLSILNSTISLSWNQFSMLLERRYLSLPLATDVRQLSIASQNTYIVLHGEISTVTHLCEKGMVINSYEFRQYIQQFLVVNSNLIVPLVKGKQIQVVGLQTATLRKVPFIFVDCGVSLQLFSFPEAKLICIKQVDEKIMGIYCRQNPGEIRLTYLDESLTKNQLEYKFNNKTQEPQKRYNKFVVQGNFHSLVVFNRLNQGSNFILKLHDIVDFKGNNQSRVRHISIPQTYSQFEWLQTWEIRRDQLIFIPYQSTSSVSNFIGVFNLLDHKIRKFKFQASEKNTNVDAMFLKEFLYLREGNISFFKSKIKPDKTYFVGIDSEEVEFEKQEQDTTERKKIRYKYDSPLCVEYHYNSSRKSIQIIRLKPLKLKQVYMQMLLCLNDDFDDDLLMDAIMML